MVKELFPDAKTVGLLYCSAEPNSEYQVKVMTAELAKLPELLRDCDAVIAATGYRTGVPACLDGLGIAREPGTDGPKLGRRHDAAWDGPPENRIYVLNAGRMSHGIADPQLALLAWRSAAVLNDALGRRVFALDEAPSLDEWSRRGHDDRFR